MSKLKRIMKSKNRTCNFISYKLPGETHFQALNKWDIQEDSGRKRLLYQIKIIYIKNQQ